MIWTRVVLNLCFGLSFIVVLIANSPTQARETVVDDYHAFPRSRDEMEAYFSKYQISYNPRAGEETLLETIKGHRDAAVNTMKFFGDHIERLMHGMSIKLQKQYGLTKLNVETLVAEVQHALRQLELRGELTQDKVRQRLGELQYKALKRKIITEAQWKDMVRELDSAFESRHWRDRLLGRRPPTSKDFSNGYHHWLTSVTERLEHDKTLTEKQVQAVKTAVGHAITSATDTLAIGNADFYRRLAHDLTSQAQFTKEQATDVLDSLRDDIIGYKIVAMQYCGRYLSPERSWRSKIGGAFHRLVLTVRTKLMGILRRLWPFHTSSDGSRAIAAIKSTASSVTRSAAPFQSIHSMKDSASLSADALHSNVVDTLESFADYWHKKERDYWQLLGYNEAQLDWIQHRLAHSFHEQTSFTRDNIQQTLVAMREYLRQAKVQSSQQIEQELDRVKSLLEAWKSALSSHDEF